MSDDRFVREPDEVEGRPYIDPKPRSWYNKAPAPPFDLAAECEKFLDSFCATFGIKRDAKKKASEPK